MGLFGRKKNGDYFVKIIESVTKTEVNMGNLTEKFNDHAAAECERRKIDREWQKGIDLKLAVKIECPRNEDVSLLMSDRKGIKLIWKVVIGVLGFAALVLGVILTLKRLGLL